MKFRNQFLLAIAVAALGATSAIANEGGISGGGADYHAFGDGAAWFLGDRAIQVCYEVAPGFVAPGAKLDIPAAFSNAVQLWKNYVQRISIYQVLGPKRQLDFNFEIHASCSGSEDLMIYLGVQSEAVARAQLQHTNPVAFVDRQSYDPRAGWGKGLIWVAPTGSVVPDEKFPNWGAPLRLQAVLTHELGHILGCDHVAGTIMQENFADLLRDGLDPGYQQARLSHIDGDRILFPVSFDYDGIVGVPQENAASGETFRLFSGRNPVGKIRAHFIMDPASRKLSLDLTDDQGKVHLAFHPNATQGTDVGTGTTAGGKIFQVAWEEDGFLQSSGLESASAVLFGTILAADGTPYIVSIEINMNGLYDPPIYGPVSIWYYGQGFRRNLFSVPVPRSTK